MRFGSSGWNLHRCNFTKCPIFGGWAHLARLDTERTARQQAEQAAAVLAAKLEAAERRATESDARTTKAKAKAKAAAARTAEKAEAVARELVSW